MYPMESLFFATVCAIAPFDATISARSVTRSSS
jgi:hypothetical protein